LRERPWRSPLLIGGAAIWLGCLAFWGFVWTVSRDQAVAMAATFGAFFVAGKIAAIPTGYLLGLPPVLIGFIVLLPDVGAVLFAYPLTHGGLRVLGKWSGFIRRMHENALRAAERREGFVARYGALGMFVLALLPVGFYSPLVISAIGQLMGLSPVRVVIPVIAGMTVMTVIWVAALGAGVEWAQAIDSRLPFVLSMGLLLTFVAIDVVKRLRQRRSPPVEREGDPPPPGPKGPGRA
jgi:putative small multi-drug export protein